MKKLTRVMAGIMAGAVIPLTLAGCSAQAPSTETTTTTAAADTQNETTAAESTAAVSSSDAVKNVYDSLTKGGSDYTKYLESIKSIAPDVVFEEKLDGDKIVISTEGTSDGLLEPGSCEFVQDGDYLTLKSAAGDLFGAGLFNYVVSAVGDALKMDPVLYPSYVNGAMLLQKDNKYASMTNESDGSMLYKIYDAASFEMSDIDDMYVTEELIKEYTPEQDSNTTDTFVALPVGKIRFVAHGDKENMVMAVGEYENYTDTSYKSLMNGVNALQPKGFEAFAEAFTEEAFKAQKDMEGNGYKVSFSVVDDMREYLGIKDEDNNFKFVVVEFGE